MPTSVEARTILQRLTSAAVESSLSLFERFDGSPTVVRGALLEAVPSEIDHFSDGAAALAADVYEEERELANAAGAFSAVPIVEDRTVKTRRAIAWASEPLFAVEPDRVLVGARLAEVIQMGVARPYRDTTLHNRRIDSASVGWRRIARSGACSFCRMLADRGAVYREATVRFATHGACHCVAQPVFDTNDTGVTASLMQYKASKRGRTAAQRAEVRAYLETHY